MCLDAICVHATMLKETYQLRSVAVLLKNNINYNSVFIVAKYSSTNEQNMKQFTSSNCVLTFPKVHYSDGLVLEIDVDASA